MDITRSEAGRRGAGEFGARRTLPDAERGATPADRARDAGIDAAVLHRLLSSMDEGDRDTIRELCARDLDTTRREAWRALRRWDRKALGRHLHVMSSLAQTIGAGELAERTARMQARLHAGACAGYDADARALDELARRAARFLAEGGE